MIMFWSIAAAMMALAIAFVLLPLFRRSKASTIDRDELNIELIKQQLAELETDLDDGKLDASEYASARKDLEKELLYDVSDNGVHGRNNEKSGRWAGILLVILIPLTSVLLYQHIGSEHLTPTPQEEHPAANQPSQAPVPSIEEMVTQLAARLESEPNNPEGWYMLARSYITMNRYADAANAYQTLLELVGDHPEVLVSYADALAMVQNGQLTGKPEKLIHKALELEPNQPQGLWLAGMAAEQQGDYRSAIAYWRRVEPLLQDDPESLTEVRQLIAMAEQRGGLPEEQTPGEDISAPSPSSPKIAMGEPATAPSGKAITINVDLDPSLKGHTKLDDSLFVFAQAVEGPPMPLAVVRKQVKDLPLEVTLDDSMAMMPAMRLSNFPVVRISARISKTGNAKPQSGDLYGEASPIPVNGNDVVQITIGKKIP
ncbi:MAG: c-type cytochrome biogenesis protein CcmI [Pseudomonadota bacterium]